MRLLIGEVSSYKAITIATFIKTYYPDCYLVTFDTKGFTRKLRTRYTDKHYVVDNTSTDAMVQNLAAICQWENIAIFLPVNSERLGDFLSKRQLFGSCLSYIGSNDAYETLNDKRQLYALAERLGIRIPRLYTDYQQVIFPCVVKPTNLSSSKNVRYYFDEKTFYKEINETIFQQNITQEYIIGVGVGYSAFCCAGNIVSGYGHSRLAEYPVSGGSSVFRSGFINAQAEMITQWLISATQWSGFAMIEFKHNPRTNELVLIEVNPRIWGSINQGLQAGTNYFEGFLGAPAKPIRQCPQVQTYLSPLLYISLIEYAMQGNWPIVLTFFRANSIQADVNWLTDFGGYWSTIVRKLFR